MGLALIRVGRVYCPGRAIVDPVIGERENTPLDPSVS